MAFSIFCLGLSQADIARRFKVRPNTVSEIAKAQDWLGKREIVSVERAKMLGADLSKEQELVRGEEIRFSKMCMAMAEDVLRRLRFKKPSVRDAKTLLDLASRLGRLGTGLPLAPLELTVQHDISATLEAALQKAYGPEAREVEAEVADLYTQPSQALP